MGNRKRKNSNYVTEKTIKAKEELLRAEKRRKIAIIVSISTAIAIAVAMLVVGIVHVVKNSGEDEEPLTITHHASITLEWNDGGTLREDNIHIELYGENAPITVENFVTLINEGYYNGLNLDKIMKNDKDNDDLFYISGGTSDEPANTIKGEFEENDVENTIPHKKGTIYMHHDEFDNDSATSAFIISLTSNYEDYLHGKYAAFGRVVDGFDVLEKIAKTFTPIDSEGNLLHKDKPIIKSISVHAPHD